MEASIRTAVFGKVIDALRRFGCFEIMSISESTHITRDLALGRLGRSELAIHLEEIFGRELPCDVVDGFVSVGDVVSYFSRRYFEDAEAPVAPSRRDRSQRGIMGMLAA